MAAMRDASPPGGVSAAAAYLHQEEEEGSWPSPPQSSSSITATPPLPHSSSFITSVTTPSTTASPVRRKPLPQHAEPVTASPQAWPSTSRPEGETPVDPPFPARGAPPVVNPASPLSSASSYEGEDSFPVAPIDLNRFPPSGSTSAAPLRIDVSSLADGEFHDDTDDYGSQFTNGTPVHSRLVSEPFIPILNSPPEAHKRNTTMALNPPHNRPPPLRIDPSGRQMSADSKNPKTPGNKISSFFGWKAATSPGAESSSTEISDAGRSPLPSPMPPSLPSASFSITPSTTIPIDMSTKSNSYFAPGRNGSLSSASALDQAHSSKINELENELREISSELAGSIRREMELEDLVERLQSEMPMEANRRTSDYFSDSGTSSIRYAYESGGRVEDVEKYKRTAEQERAELKVQLSQKWQEERSRRTATESHIQILENQVQQFRRERVENSDLSSRNKELESALEDTRRKLAEERQIKDNFEDLLTAMRVELEQLRNERDHLREDVIPQLKSGVPVDSSSDPSEMERLLGEIEALKIENASLAQLQTTRFASIAEESGVSSRRSSGLGLSRSNSLARMPSKPSGLSRSSSLSRSNSVSAKDRENRESLADRVKDVEAQRDALHQALRSLLDRQAYQARQFEKRTKLLEMELERAQQSGSPQRLGYEREVYTLRQEVNHLRFRAEDAIEQKWQCEKGLAGLKMDLDRAEQETTSLRELLQEHDISVPEGVDAEQNGFAEVLATSSSLESAYKQLQADRENAEASAAQSPQDDQTNADQLAASLSRTDDLANLVRRQLQTNNSLRTRLADAIGKGETEQQLSASRINKLQSRLKELEDVVLLAQQHSEEEMSKHEEEVLRLKESHNDQLMRMKNGARSPAALSPKPPSSPFGARSPRLDKTTSGDGMPLNGVIQPEKLEKRVKELEKLLRDADMEMEEVVGRMNRAQIEVAELQSNRDEALRETRRLQAEIQAERDAFRALMG